MVRYPDIAIFEYKDKILNIKIPIKIKKIVLRVFTCKKCREEGTTTDFKKYYTKEYQIKNKISNIFMSDPKCEKYVQSMFNSTKGTFICPTCKKLCKPIEKVLYKLYVNPQGNYVSCSRIIKEHFFIAPHFRWRPEQWNEFAPEKYVLFVKSLDDIYEYIADNMKWQKKNRKAKNKKFKLKFAGKKITKRQLTILHKEAELDKIARKI